MTADLFESVNAPQNSQTAEWLVAHCDGGSRGNPGHSGYGAVIEDGKGAVRAELSEYLGIQTNNFAEYSGLLAVLRWAIENGAKRLRVVSDSELMVRQMQGRYKVASPTLKPLFEEARKLSRKLEGFELTHTLRAGNKTADRLANEAMDKGSGRPAAGPPPTAKQPYFALKSLTPKPLPRTEPATAPKRERQVLEGYVKGGVVHLLEGELPEGCFVKIVRE
jgi:ribonuclease HI